jgi:putative nucleotidyltransferase with HDIG domain
VPGLLRRSGFLRTRFARRTLLAFLGAALLPSALAAALWFARLRATLDAEANAALAAAARTAGVALLERLDLLVSRSRPAAGDGRADGGQPRLALGDVGGAPVPFVAFDDASPAITGQPLPTSELWNALDQLLGGVDSGYCVLLTEPLRPLHCSAGLPPGVRRAAVDAAATADPRAVRFAAGWRLTAREVFLRAQYEAPSWHLVVAHADAPLAARLREETRYFTAIGLLALVTAFALSHVQLRRQTAPIELLQRATRDVREGRLETRVALRGNDEFTEFGDTFNAMAHSLQQQFALLGDVDALNERALRAGDEADLVEAALERLGGRTGARIVGVCLVDVDQPDRLHYRTRVAGAVPTRRDGAGRLEAECRALLLEAEPRLCDRTLPQCRSLVDPTVEAWRSPEVARVLVVPLRHQTEPIGAVLLALGAAQADDQEALDAERRLAERLGLGLANARLVNRLDALSLGTLRAFGSTIDANSRWTAGHSERVTHLAVQLGDALGLSAAERLTLRRGCLLHDIGKVGIPASVLDKPGRLTDGEFALIKRHPVIGAEILGPIAAFRDLLPIVRSHHERFDGLGYPDGLRGEAIPYLARIAAVADVFDALASARPYREGLPLVTVQRMIGEGRGSQFDPRVVDALETLLADGRLVLRTDGGTADREPPPTPVEAVPGHDLFPAIA